MWSPTVSSDELYHHGILGQRWGHKNGPPYPLDSSDYSKAEKKAAKKSARAERRAERKEKKRLKKDFKLEKKAAKAEEARQKILNTGSLNDIRKLRKKGQISNSEYTEVFKRLENEQKLDDFDKKKKANMAEKMNSAKNMVSTINSGSQQALQLYNRGASVYNQIARRKGWSVQNLPIIKETDDYEDKQKQKKKEYFINKASADEVERTKDNYSAEDLGKAISRFKTNKTWDEYYEEHKKKKKEDE